MRYPHPITFEESTETRFASLDCDLAIRSEGDNVIKETHECMGVPLPFVDIRLEVWQKPIARRELLVERWRGRAGEMPGTQAGW